MWLLACWQIGFQTCHVACASSEARENLTGIRKLTNKTSQVVEEPLDDVKSGGEWDLILIDMDEVSGDLWDKLSTNCRRVVQCGSRGARRTVRGARNGQRTKAFSAKHAKMGGATNARTTLIWTGEDLERINLDQLSFPQRPHGDWLDLAAPLWTEGTGVKQRIKSPVWSAPAEKLFPWPLPQGDLPTIEAPSVFLRGKLASRSITLKEMASLLDVPATWPKSLITEIWRWKGGRCIPLRIYVEAMMSMWEWLQPPNTKCEEDPGTTGLQTRIRKATRMMSEKLLKARVATRVGDSTLFRLTHFSWVWEPQDESVVSTATKGDGATVDTTLWNIGGDKATKARGIIQRVMHKWWRRRLLHEVHQEMVRAKALGSWEEVAPYARKCAERAGQSTWFEWAGGSQLFYWRWPKWWREEARLGAKALHLSWPPRRKTARKVPRESAEQTRLLAGKLNKLILRGYIVPANPEKLWCVIPYFAVPKGLDDIRVVWSDTENGVNPSLYAPSFFMPLPDTLFRRMGDDVFLGDFDVGEMFHNFPLHPFEQQFAGIQIDEELQKLLGCGPFYRWSRVPFGWRPSPYLAIRMMARAVEIAIGDRTDPENPFWWTHVELNLPGTPGYDPGVPWVMKLRGDGKQACDVVLFVDDGRIIAATEELATRATRQIAAGIQHLGIQDASRKRRRVSQRPGAWAGTVVYTDQGLARKFVSQKKWDKAREILDWLESQLKSKGGMPTKELMSYRGFLVHLSMTYTFMRPYLKGLHLTIDSWREGRDEQGWASMTKMGATEGVEADPYEEATAEGEAYLARYMISGEGDTEEDGPRKRQKFDSTEVPGTPEKVFPVPRLVDDIRALKTFFATEKPAMVALRPVNGCESLIYGFVDASGSGFGGTWRQHKSGETAARHGFWCTAVSEESSNYREFRNLVEHVQEQVVKGTLAGREVWVFTDNAVTENAIFSGTSKSRKLFELVLRLRQLEIEGSFSLRVVHVAGTRMIGEGTDGLSRGEVNPKALLDPVLGSVPLNEFALGRAPQLKDWLDNWLDPGYNLASPNDWFGKAQQGMFENENPDTPETWVWDIPPAAAPHILEELALGRVKRHNVLRGVVLIPGLMRPAWFRRFVRVVDCYFVLPAGKCPHWPTEMHEPLTIGLYLPLLKYRPWDWKRVPFLVASLRQVQSLHKEDYRQGGDLLRELWQACIWIHTMPERLVSRLLSDQHHGPFLSVARERSGNRRGRH